MCAVCRQFEETQGRLEAAVEQCALPLALVPGTQVRSLASASADHMEWRGTLLVAGNGHCAPFKTTLTKN